jgi:hypothetical protein
LKWKIPSHFKLKIQHTLELPADARTRQNIAHKMTDDFTMGFLGTLFKDLILLLLELCLIVPCITETSYSVEVHAAQILLQAAVIMFIQFLHKSGYGALEFFVRSRTASVAWATIQFSCRIKELQTWLCILYFTHALINLSTLASEKINFVLKDQSMPLRSSFFFLYLSISNGYVCRYRFSLACCLVRERPNPRKIWTLYLFNSVTLYLRKLLVIRFEQ